MRRVFKTTVLGGIIALALLSSSPASAAEEDDDVALKPLGHFFVAATAHFTISTLCERAWPERRYACRIGAAGLVSAAAYWELKRYDAFNHEDLIANMLGVGFSLIVLEW